MITKYNAYKKEKCSLSSFYKRSCKGLSFEDAIKPVDKSKLRTKTIYYSKGRGYNVLDLVKLTGKSILAIRVYIYKHPDDWTVEAIRDGSRQASSRKRFIKGEPIKKRCEKRNINYQAGYRMIKNGELIPDFVKSDNQSISRKRKKVFKYC